MKLLTIQELQSLCRRIEEPINTIHYHFPIILGELEERRNTDYKWATYLCSKHIIPDPTCKVCNPQVEVCIQAQEFCNSNYYTDYIKLNEIIERWEKHKKYRNIPIITRETKK